VAQHLEVDGDRGAAQRYRLLEIMENDFDPALLWGFSAG
jgi:hypothetical protein